MREDLDFLEKFPKDHNDLYIVYELYTFDNLFRLLLKSDFDHEEALCFILTNCSLSALVFQERIYNKVYKKFSPEDPSSADLLAFKVWLIYAMWIMMSRR